MPEVFASVEAQRKMKARGVTWEEVEYATLHPDITWRNAGLSGKMYDIHACGDLGVVLKRMGKDWQVISIIWRKSEQWTDGEMFIERMVYQEPKKPRLKN